MNGYTNRPTEDLDVLITEQTKERTHRCPWCGATLPMGQRCRKRMCQLEEMGDSPSDYPRSRRGPFR